MCEEDMVEGDTSAQPDTGELSVAAPTLDDLQRQLGVELPDQGLLRQALIHASYLNERPAPAVESNERLEFLGDAVLGALAADYLYRSFPDLPEGELTSLRAAVVRARSLAAWARQLQLGEMLVLGRGEEAHGGRDREPLLSAAFEAVLAAVYLQLGYEAAGKVLDLFLPAAIESVLRRHAAVDAKSQLQQVCQAIGRGTPVYQVVEISGPAHRPVYTVEVLADGIVLARGIARGKRAAEQLAAAEAMGVVCEGGKPAGLGGSQEDLEGPQGISSEA